MWRNRKEQQQYFTHSAMMFEKNQEVWTMKQENQKKTFASETTTKKWRKDERKNGQMHWWPVAWMRYR